MTEAQRVVSTFFSELFSPIRNLTASDWLESNIVLLDPHHNIDGPVDFERYPYLREPIDSMCDPDVPSTVLCFSAQMLKTTALIMATAYRLANRPSDIIWGMDRGDACREFSISRWQPIIKANPELMRLMPDNPDLFKNMTQYMTVAALRFLGAGSPGALASNPAGYANLDEVDKWPKWFKDEAGAVELILERLAGAPNAAFTMASTPTFPDGAIWKAFLSRDQRHRYGPCKHCKKLFKIEFDNLKWSQNFKNNDGTWDIEGACASAHVECPHCGGDMQDSDKRAWDKGGEWIAENDNPSELGRSYRVNRLMSPLPQASFGNFVRKHLDAGNDPSKRQNFTNSWLGEPFVEEAEAIPAASIIERLEYYKSDPLPEGVLVLCVGADVQRGKENDPLKPPRIEAELVGFGMGCETWGLEKKVFVGDIEDMSDVGPWAKMDNWLFKRYQHPSGVDLGIACTFVDAGYQRDIVVDYCAARMSKRVFPCMGKNKGAAGDPLVTLARAKNRQGVPMYYVSRYTGNQWVYSLIKVNDEGPNYQHFPNDPSRGYDIAYFQQLTAERLVIKRRAGQRIEKWEDDGKATEALACRRYAWGAFRSLNADMEIIAKQLEVKKEEKPKQAPKQAPQQGQGFRFKYM